MGKPLARYDWIEPLPAPIQAAVRECMTIRRYEDHEFIYRRGDAGNELYQIISGHVRLYVLSPEGRELLYVIFEPGSCFGELSLIDRQPRAHMTQAFGSTEIAVIARRQFEELWLRHPEISHELCRMLCKRSRKLFNNFEAANLIPLPNRIANQLCELANSLGNPCPDGIHFDMRITQEDIGFMVGSSRQSVNKVLKVWQ